MGKVHVIYKTHLDIGYTDLAKNVMDQYLEVFIPKAIELAEKLNLKEKQFIWTPFGRGDDDRAQKIKGKISQ